MKPSNDFTVVGYEVRFLQSAPVTVCVIRSLTDHHQKYAGVAVCHPDVKWNETIGRRNALNAALRNGGTKLPIKEIRLAYAWNYMETWTIGEMVKAKI